MKLIRFDDTDPDSNSCVLSHPCEFRQITSLKAFIFLTSHLANEHNNQNNIMIILRNMYLYTYRGIYIYREKMYTMYTFYMHSYFMLNNKYICVFYHNTIILTYVFYVVIVNKPTVCAYIVFKFK